MSRTTRPSPPRRPTNNGQTFTPISYVEATRGRRKKTKASDKILAPLLNKPNAHTPSKPFMPSKSSTGSATPSRKPKHSNKNKNKKQLIKARELLGEHDKKSTTKNKLALACEIGDKEFINNVSCLPKKELIPYVKATFISGFTALHLACEKGHFTHVKWLLKHGADVRHTTRDGWTPTHTCVEFNHLDILKYIVAHGAKADLRKKNEEGTTPFMISCHSGHLNITEYIANTTSSIDISEANNKGYTPMHAACEENNFKTVKWLYKNGAAKDMSSKNYINETPIDMAKKKRSSEQGGPELIQWLKELYGTKPRIFTGRTMDFLRPDGTVEKFKGENECAICFEAFVKGENITALPCTTMSHIFHTKCITPWTDKKDTCPLCRDKVPF